MPKLHDACQILAEELLAGLAAFPPAERQLALATAWTALLDHLAANHPDAAVLIRHLDLVMEELLARQAILVPDHLYQTRNDVAANDHRYTPLGQQAIQTARLLFSPGSDPTLPD